MEIVLASLEASLPAVLLRGSLWMYPAVNTGHIIGIALLIGGIIPLDLRLLGLWPKVPLVPLLRVLMRTAAVGLSLAIVCGFLLFITRASAYAGSDVFTVKMFVVSAGLVNGLMLRIVLSPHNPPQWALASTVPPAVKAGACISLATWLTAVILGRLIGYVH